MLLAIPEQQPMQKKCANKQIIVMINNKMRHKMKPSSGWGQAAVPAKYRIQVRVKCWNERKSCRHKIKLTEPRKSTQKKQSNNNNSNNHYDFRISFYALAPDLLFNYFNLLCHFFSCASYENWIKPFFHCSFRARRTFMPIFRHLNCWTNCCSCVFHLFRFCFVSFYCTKCVVANCIPAMSAVVSGFMRDFQRNKQ